MKSMKAIWQGESDPYYAIAYIDRHGSLTNRIEPPWSQGQANQLWRASPQPTSLRLDDRDHVHTRWTKAKQSLAMCFYEQYQKYLLNYLEIIG